MAIPFAGQFPRAISPMEASDAGASEDLGIFFDGTLAADAQLERRAIPLLNVIMRSYSKALPRTERSSDRPLVNERASIHLNCSVLHLLEGLLTTNPSIARVLRDRGLTMDDVIRICLGLVTAE